MADTPLTVFMLGGLTLNGFPSGGGMGPGPDGQVPLDIDLGEHGLDPESSHTITIQYNATKSTGLKVLKRFAINGRLDSLPNIVGTNDAGQSKVEFSRTAYPSSVLAASNIDDTVTLYDNGRKVAVGKIADDGKFVEGD
jgi:hypothetical protein